MQQVQRRSPFQGLIPYAEEDAAFFFGREKEVRLIIANFFAAPLTLLYGPSGVGKSSVLHAGVVHQLQQRNDLLAVVFDTWQGDAVIGLKATVAEAAAGAVDRSMPEPESTSLAEYLADCAARLNRRLMLILDQFEEYFLYHPQHDAFAVEFPRAVMQTDLPISFLISLREDSLAKLDRFEGRIPMLFDNYMRLEHLDRQSARVAIEKPVEQYNTLVDLGRQPVRVEPDLAETVLEEVKTGQALLSGGRGVIQRGAIHAGVHVETPYLQMVMTRLWDEEMRANSFTLRRDTLKRLGGAEHIVRTHLDEVMEKLNEEERDLSARVFHFLVTPSGAKIGHTAADLSGYAKVSQTELVPVLEKLSSGQIRILRTAAPALGQAEVRYEIFHDVLAPAVLDWRTRYIQVQELAEAEHRTEKEKQRAEESSRLYEQLKVRNEFLAVASHELRTPLSVIWGNADLLTDKTFGEINPRQEQALNAITGQFRNISAIVNHMLLVAGLEFGQVGIEKKELHLINLLNDLRSVYEKPLGKEVTLIWDYPSDLPIIKTDSDKIREIFKNLIDNSLKFTETGNVIISVRYIPATKSTEFKVGDTGIGIPKDKQAMIFDMFRQVDSSETRQYGGVGLGLYIVKVFAELLGGKIEVESEPGKGSVFTVTIPDAS